MRCPDCEKFVPYNTEETPEGEAEVNEDEVVVAVRRVLTCGECGTELKEANFDTHAEIDPAGLEDCINEGGDDHEWEVEEESYDPTTGIIDTDRKGRRITNPRYQKTTYGFEGTVTIKCEHCKQTLSFTFSDDLQASSFDELV